MVGNREKFKLNIDFVPGDWRTGADPEIVEKKLKEDTNKEIKAVFVVHNENINWCCKPNR